jgi:hypothetical protein
MRVARPAAKMTMRLQVMVPSSAIFRKRINAYAFFSQGNGMHGHLLRFECFNRSCPLAPWKDGKRRTTSPGAVDFTAARSQLHRLLKQLINSRGGHLQPF